MRFFSISIEPRAIIPLCMPECKFDDRLTAETQCVHDPHRLAHGLEAGPGCKPPGIQTEE
jgi:hypothetical protein